MYLNEYAIVNYTCDTSVIACMSWRMILDDIRYRSPFKHKISDWWMRLYQYESNYRKPYDRIINEI